jgi:hypothetical protein
LYNTVHAGIHSCDKPLITATFWLLEKIEPLEVYIRGHPRWIVSTEEERKCIDNEDKKYDGCRNSSISVAMNAYPLTHVPD